MVDTAQNKENPNAKKVLIVEDEPGLGKILVDKMNALGFVGFHEPNGKKGLDTALRIHPNIILLDLLMPEMSGLQMLEELRKDEWGRNTPVLVMTNLTDDKSLEDALKYGALGYLVKAQWRLEDVAAKIQAHIEG